MATSPGGCRQTLNPSRERSTATLPSQFSVSRTASSHLEARYDDACARRIQAALLRLVVPLAAAARALIGCQGWKHLGYARLSDHARERLGRSAGWVRDLADLDDALQCLPRLSAAIAGEDGGRPLGIEAARQIGRVADASSLPVWLRLARRESCRALKEKVRRAVAEGSRWPVDDSAPINSVRRAWAEGSGWPIADRTQMNKPGAMYLHLPSTVEITIDRERQHIENRIHQKEPISFQVLSLPVPAPAREAFIESHDLYRAVEGRPAGSDEFVSSLVADTCSGPLAGRVGPGEVALAPPWHNPPDANSLPRENRPPHENDLAACSRPGAGEMQAMIGSSSPSPHGSSTAETAARSDKEMQRLIAVQDQLEYKLVEAVTKMADAASWHSLGYKNIGDYAQRALRWSRSSLYSRVNLMRRLRRLPVVSQAYRNGRIGLSAADAVAGLLSGESTAGVVTLRVAHEIQKAWVDRAATCTMKRLQDEIRAAGRLAVTSRTSAVPGITGRTNAGPEVKGRNNAGSGDAHPLPLQDDAWHASLYREVGTARERIQALGAMALAHPGPMVRLRLVLSAETAKAFKSVLAAARRHPKLVQMFRLDEAGVPEWAALLALLGDFVTTWDVDMAGRRPSAQRIYSRDGWRCMAPGCTSRRNLETHHVVYRSQGGKDEPGNLVCLCRFHHQMGEHGGLARVRGAAPLGLVWRLGREGCGGRFRNELRLTD